MFIAETWWKQIIIVYGEIENEEKKASKIVTSCHILIRKMTCWIFIMSRMIKAHSCGKMSLKLLLWVPLGYLGVVKRSQNREMTVGLVRFVWLVSLSKFNVNFLKPRLAFVISKVLWSRDNEVSWIYVQVEGLIGRHKKYRILDVSLKIPESL